LVSRGRREKMRGGSAVRLLKSRKIAWSAGRLSNKPAGSPAMPLKERSTTVVVEQQAEQSTGALPQQSLAELHWPATAAVNATKIKQRIVIRSTA